MTLCVIDKGHCMCQPDEGVFCPNYKPDAYVQCLMDAITELLEMRVVCGECGYTVVASQATPQLHAGMLICQECGSDRVDPRSVCPKGADYRCPMIARA